MSLKNTIANLRKKPQHVREGILLVTMAVLVPVIFTIWIATLHFKSNEASTSSLIKNVNGTVSGSSNNPAYQTTFGTASLFDGSTDESSVPASDQAQSTTPTQ